MFLPYAEKDLLGCIDDGDKITKNTNLDDNINDFTFKKDYKSNNTS